MTGFETIQGRVQIGHASRLTIDQMSYALMVTSWFDSPLDVVLTHTLSLSSEIQVGPDTKLTLAGSAMLTQLSMLDTATTNDSQTAGPRPAGNPDFLTVQASEALSSQLSTSWTMDQSLAGRLYRPINEGTNSTTNRSLTFNTQLTHQWQRDAAGLRGTIGVIESSRNAGTDAQTGQPVAASRSSEFGEAALLWRHDWTPDFTHELVAGVYALRSDQTVLMPSGSAGVHWRDSGREIELRAGQRADSNIYVGIAYKRQFVTLRIAAPLNRTETLRLLADGNAENASTTSASNGVQGSAKIFYARVGLRWQPGDTFAYGLEYMFRDQRAATPETGSSSPFTTLRRQTAMFTIEATYPSRL